MYKLTRKGKEEPIMLDDTQGLALFTKWTNGEHLPAKIAIGGLAFLTSDIKAIEKVQQSVAEVTPPPSDADYRAFRKKMLSLSLEERANILKIPKIVWQAHLRTVPMPEDIKKEIRKRQLAYFKENPQCIFANPKIYKDLIPDATYEPGKSAGVSVHNLLPAVVMGIIADNIQTDLTYSKRV